MKFSKIRFEKIGPFDNTTLDFSTGNPGLHIVYGSNEAGKSSALKYIEWFLFGIPPQNDDNFKHKFGDFLIESTILDNNSKTHLLKRRKTPIGRTILDANNLDATPLLEPMLGGLVRETFSMQFGISHAKLRAGGRNVLEGEGDLGTMIFEAGAGLANLRKILQQLEERAAEIYPSKNSKLSLTLKEAKENQEEIEKTKLSLGTWQNASELVANLQKKVDELGDERKAWISKQAECESIIRALPQLTKFKTAESTLKELENIPLVDDATLIKYQAAEKFLTSSNALLEQQQKRVLDISTKLENLNPNEKVLTVRSEIEALNQSSDLLLKNLLDIANRQKEKDAKEDQIKVLLKDYCTDTSFDESRNLFIDQKTQIQILELSTLINTEKALIDSTKKNIDSLTKKIKDLKQEEINQAP
ncbi:MAG: AAA family ATPase, partial [Gemmataceae bacterium]|nr:AAA family ATPase [Gemmataceae bacterium]